jgi:hypothetical protein
MRWAMAPYQSPIQKLTEDRSPRKKIKNTWIPISISPIHLYCLVIISARGQIPSTLPYTKLQIIKSKSLDVLMIK